MTSPFSASSHWYLLCWVVDAPQDPTAKADLVEATGRMKSVLKGLITEQQAMENLVPTCDAVIAAGSNFDRFCLSPLCISQSALGRFYGSTFTNTIENAEQDGLKMYNEGKERQQSHTHH